MCKRNSPEGRRKKKRKKEKKKKANMGCVRETPQKKN